MNADSLVAAIRSDHGVSPPGAAALVFAAELEAAIADFADLPPGAFCDEPADFLRVLDEARETDARPRRAQAADRSPLPSGSLCELSLAELSRLLAKGAVSSVEATQACLDRFDSLGPRSNAFIWIDPALALSQAAAADARRRRGESGPLLGAPMAHKDMFAMDGRRSTCGSRIRAGDRPPGRATALARLEAAGAVTLGGLNMAEFAQGPTGHNPHFGDCRNPWNVAYVSGGSSSGSGAAVADGLAFGALGSDTGGSIRIPASCCGIVGLKPTAGRVSRHGAMPLSFSMDCIGPMARTARDCAIMLSAIAGCDERDRTTSAAPVADYAAGLDGDLRGVRIGACVQPVAPAGDAVRSAFEQALDVLAARGAVVSRVDLPRMDRLAAYSAVVSRVELATLHAAWMRERPQDYSASVSNRIYPNFRISGVHYVEALRERGPTLRAFLAAAFATIDVLALPTIPEPIPTRAETDVDRLGGAAVRRFLSLSANTRAFSYLGLPALSAPCGFDPNGLPIGLQLVARPFAEDRLLHVADAYERDAGWRRPPEDPK